MENDIVEGATAKGVINSGERTILLFNFDSPLICVLSMAAMFKKPSTHNYRAIDRITCNFERRFPETHTAKHACAVSFFLSCLVDL